MALRKAIGAVKDQTSIGIAKVSSNIAPELEVAIVKAMSHDDEPTPEKYIREILHLSAYSRGHVSVCVSTISKRLGKTRDWIVAIKCLMLIQRLMSDGDPVFQQEMMYATRRGTRLLNMSDFRDEAHSNSWDHSAFVKTFALYLDQKLELMCFERKVHGTGGEIEKYGSREERWRSPPNRHNDYDYNESRDEPGYDNSGMRRSRSSGDVREGSRDERKVVTPLREMTPERILGRMSHLQRLLERFLASKPSNIAKNSRMVLVALYPMVKESFKLYADICEVLTVLLDRFFDMEYSDCVKTVDAYVSAAKQIDELISFYNWCKDIGLARSSEYPEVQKITSKLLETLEEFVRDRAKGTRSSPKRKPELPPPEEEAPVPDMNEIKALPAPENYSRPPPPEPVPPAKPQKQQETGDLVDLRADSITGDEQGNKLAIALFAGPAGNNNNNGTWEAFPSNGESEVTSAWQNPAAEQGKADWELALVETTSNLSLQKAAMGGGLDPLLLNGMYDQGMVRQYNSSAQSSGGSASSVAMPGTGKNSTPVLALPAPDGTGQTTVVVGQDPFAASLNFLPPSYVQMSDMEKKQQMLAQEQMVWNQYAREGMQGQTSLNKAGGPGYYGPGVGGVPPMMPYGMPPGNGGMGMPPAGYYYSNPY
ncbi:putative clathrin assembly protein At2g25430 [Impatiens glandulifera]|uniref:putative clathrin assembly protein At2g25430 n=1 Tax=Impatiens glandulifera TaxID=253017 RepID=UPI001FB12143|nr:putative clathrin assembly protein At2g25430 [Impatiens glandulifera]